MPIPICKNFIDIDVKIPKIAIYDEADDYSSGTVKSYCWKLEKELGFNVSPLLEIFSGAVECLTAMAAHLDLSLRQIEKVFTNLSNLSNLLRNERFDLTPLILVLISVVKVVNPKLFEKILYEQAYHEEIIEELDLTAKTQQNGAGDNYLKWLSGDIKRCFITAEERNTRESTTIKENRIAAWGRNHAAQIAKRLAFLV